MIELKPCPFCGSEVDFCGADQDDDGSFIPARIFCSSCGVTMIGEYKKLKYDNRGRLIGGWLTEKELNEYNNELAKSWNRRSLEK